jgi:hypothetical protein
MPRKDEPMAHDDSTNAWPAIDEAVEPGLLLEEELSGGLGGGAIFVRDRKLARAS